MDIEQRVEALTERIAHEEQRRNQDIGMVLLNLKDLNDRVAALEITDEPQPAPVCNVRGVDYYEGDTVGYLVRDEPTGTLLGLGDSEDSVRVQRYDGEHVWSTAHIALYARGQ